MKTPEQRPLLDRRALGDAELRRTRPDLAPLPASTPRQLTRLDVVTAIGHWLRGRMLDEDEDCSITRSDRAALRLINNLAHPEQLPPTMLWDQIVLADARAIFGHHFEGTP